MLCFSCNDFVISRHSRLRNQMRVKLQVNILINNFWMLQYICNNNSNSYWNNLAKRPSSHSIMDPPIQQINKKTSTPAKIVRKGGPWPASLSDFSSNFSPEGFEFDANTLNNLYFGCNFTMCLHLNLQNILSNKPENLWSSILRSVPIYHQNERIKLFTESWIFIPL